MAHFHFLLLLLCMGASWAVLHNGNAHNSSSHSNEAISNSTAQLDIDASDSTAVGYRYTDSARKVLPTSPTRAPNHKHHNQQEQQQQQQHLGYSYQPPVASYASYSLNGYPLYKRTSQTAALAVGLHDEHLHQPAANAPKFILLPRSTVGKAENKAVDQVQTYFVPRRQQTQAAATSVIQPQVENNEFKGYTYAQPHAPTAEGYALQSQAAQSQAPSAVGIAEQLRASKPEAPSTQHFAAQAQVQVPSSEGYTSQLQTYQPQVPSAAGYAAQSQGSQALVPTANGFTYQPQEFQLQAPTAEGYASQLQGSSALPPTANGFTYQPQTFQPQVPTAEGYENQLQGSQALLSAAKGFTYQPQTFQLQGPTAEGYENQLKGAHTLIPPAQGYSYQPQAFQPPFPTAETYENQQRDYQPQSPTVEDYATQQQAFQTEAPLAVDYSNQPQSSQAAAAVADDIDSQDLRQQEPEKAAALPTTAFSNPKYYFKPDFQQFAAENEATGVASQANIANTQQAALSYQNQVTKSLTQPEYDNSYSPPTQNYAQQGISQDPVSQDNGYHYQQPALSATTTPTDASLSAPSFFSSSKVSKAAPIAEHNYQNQNTATTPQFAYTPQYQTVATAAEVQNSLPQNSLPNQPLFPSYRQQSVAVQSHYPYQAGPQLSYSYPSEQTQPSADPNTYLATAQPSTSFHSTAAATYGPPPPTTTTHFGTQTLPIPASTHLPASDSVRSAATATTESSSYAATEKGLGHYPYTVSKPTALATNVENSVPVKTLLTDEHYPAEKAAMAARVSSAVPYTIPLSGSTGGSDYLQMLSHSYEVPSYVTMLSEGTVNPNPSFFPTAPAPVSYQLSVRRPHAFYGAPFETTAPAVAGSQAPSVAENAVYSTAPANTYLPPSAQQNQAFK